MLAQDSDMSQPVQYDPNTGVSYYPWEEAEMGAVRSYNLTNMATIKDWSPTIVWIDMFWGGFLTSFVSSISIYLTKTFFPS